MHNHKPQTRLQLLAQNSHTAVAESTNHITQKTPYHKPNAHTTAQEQQLKITLKDKPSYSTSEGFSTHLSTYCRIFRLRVNEKRLATIERERAKTERLRAETDRERQRGEERSVVS